MAKGWRIRYAARYSDSALLAMELRTGSSSHKKCLCLFLECRCAIVTSLRINFSEMRIGAINPKGSKNLAMLERISLLVEPVGMLACNL